MSGPFLVFLTEGPYPVDYQESFEFYATRREANKRAKALNEDPDRFAKVIEVRPGFMYDGERYFRLGS